MRTLEIFLLAVGLSMDNMAVAAAAGSDGKRHSFAQIAKVTMIFFFIGIILLITGWVGGVNLHNVIKSWDHWLAFLILCYIGVKMLKEASGKLKKHPQNKKSAVLTLKTILALALATNIDALAAGISLALYDVSLLKVLIILTLCIITATSAGFALGQKLGKKCGAAIEMLGGIILITLGLKILLESIL
jgi:putative Mn2+ efflux pump MntP